MADANQVNANFTALVDTVNNDESRITALEGRVGTTETNVTALQTGLGTTQTNITALQTVAWEAGTGPGDLVYTGGNVGIGTTSPTADLEVNGTIKATVLKAHPL